MKRIALLVLMLIALSGCGNRDMFDSVYTFNYGIVCLADGTIVEGKVDSWRDYDDGDQLQITIKGETYLVHSSNATLMVHGR